MNFMKWLLLIIAIILFTVYYRKRNKKRIDEKPVYDKSKKININELNSCVVLFLDLYNELTERVKSSINSDKRFNIDEKIILIKETEKGDVESIKKSLRQFHLQGKFNDVIDDFLIRESDIETLIYRLIEISKSTSNIPNHLLIELEPKEIYIQSFLQKEIETKIRTELFLINSVKEVESILLELISISSTKLESMALSKII